MAARYTVSPIPAAALDAGMNLSNLAAIPILLTYDTVGDIVQKAWYGIASSHDACAAGDFKALPHRRRIGRG